MPAGVTSPGQVTGRGRQGGGGENGGAAGGDGAREGGRFSEAVAGWYRVELPDRENLDRAQLDLMVHPDRRRRGLGRMLLQHAAARTAAHGRSVLNGADLKADRLADLRAGREGGRRLLACVVDRSGAR